MWRLGKQQLIIGGIAAILIVLLQLYYGTIPRSFTLKSVLAVIYPYSLIVLCALIFNILRAPWVLDTMREKEFDSLASQTAHLRNDEDEKARHKLLRERLGEFMKEGTKIRWGMITRVPHYNQKLQPWLDLVKQFLMENPEFDGSHITRFEAEQLQALKEFIIELRD